MNERLKSLGDVVARDIGGTVSVVAEGDWPSVAIAFSGRHVVLVRDHQGSFSVSLPVEGSWRLSTVEEWPRIARAVRGAVAAHLARFPSGASLADAIVSLRPLLPDFEPSFPGTPVPTEAWMNDGERSVGLFQRDNGVSIVVWVGGSMRSKTCSSPSSFANLRPWLESELGEQDAFRAAELEAKARRAALPIPSMNEVLDRLRGGERIQVGGGRYSETYFMVEGTLRCEIFDEGSTEIVDGKEAALERSIRLYPDSFRKP